MVISRRNLLISGATLGAASAASFLSWELSKQDTNARVVVVGGGAAGIAIANKLQMYLNGVRITVVDPRPYHWYQPGQTLLLAGVYDNKEDVISPNKQYLNADIRWIEDQVTEFDPDNNQVLTGQSGRLDYDYLIVSTGLELRYDLIEGLDPDQIGQDGISSIYHSPEAGLASHRQAMKFAQSGGGKGIFTRPHGAMKCAGAPMKATNLVEYFVRQAGQRERFQMDYMTAENVLFSVKVFDARLQEIWQERQIAHHYEHELKAINSQTKQAWFGTKEGGTIETSWDFIHISPPMSAIPVVRHSPLANNSDFKGYLDVDKYTLQHKRYPNVFGLGDTVGTPVGKTAASVKSQLPVVATNLTALIREEALPAQWDGYTSCPMILDVGHAMLWEFDYTLQPVTALPFEVVDPLKESKLSWVMEKSLLRPIYDVMLEGYTPI
ncbi:NAD(P)/FAD-dependent oxidoreductase [Marinomonas sp. IMCC 4694]|uniref:NAD(P)/FAD-dependent oxidoreductase n=1 Tax=Marinomonas sp. IMCC 4694 TaxID=2605432 RepID=UPI0011E7784F|nr:FAD/NAD(P)-binding oxidoreductase [Marinomonas sp. IMCC 4694]TYL47581.1 NAD(P)/FAD-dependent oxidoreductase [Marinomonas sp. IMCC 4694]